MKTSPTVWSLGALLEHCKENTTCISGRWVPARPLGFFGLMLGWRLKLAWRVFTGELDAVKWPRDQ